MIRINLLPVRAAKKQELGKQQIVLFALVVVGTLIGNFYWYSDRSSAEERLQAQVTGMKREIEELDRIIGEVKNIAKERDAIKAKLSVLDTLKKGKTGPVKMLDAMATCIPKNVWLKQLKEESGKMELQGSALSNDDLAEFMKALTAIAWTPEGMARVVGGRTDSPTNQVELVPSGQMKELPKDGTKLFFKGIVLKKSTLRKTGEEKVVDFSLTLATSYTI